MVELACLFEGKFDDALGPRGEDHLLLHGCWPPRPTIASYLLTNLSQIDSKRLEHLSSGTSPSEIANFQAEYAGSNIVVYETLRFFLSEWDVCAALTR